MTQPPQPPNDPSQGGPGEPPAGGFGAPIEPPPGGFGAPMPPPSGQPGYGYPQTPPAGAGQYGYPQQPTQPAGQPQYGYPQQQPGQPPYGYPQQGQPQYGYPQAPGQPYTQPGQPGPGTPGGKKISAQAKIIIAAVVAVVLIVGGGVYVASGGDDKKDQAGTSGSTDGDKGGDKGGTSLGGGTEKPPANTKSKVAFQLPQPKVTDITDVSGSWITDKAYVKSGLNQIVGHEPDTGKQLWTIPLPGQICAASRHTTEDDKTAVVFAASKPTAKQKFVSCTEVGAIDLAAGKLLWTKSVTGGNAGDNKAAFREVTLSGTTVAVGGTEGGAAFDLATGENLWKPEVNAEGCYDMGYGGGAGLVAARKCGSYDDPSVLIQNVNPADGAPLSTFKMPAGVEYVSVVSTKPLVVAADVGDTAGDGSGISDFFSIDEKTGKLRAKISVDADRYAARCAATEVEQCTKLAVGNDRIYVPTEEHEGTGDAYGQTNEIVSFDLATGKATTDRADAGERYAMYPLRMDGSNIIAYKWPPYDAGGKIVSIDGGTFEETVLLENPADKTVREAETSFSLDGAEVLYGNGRMYTSETLISKPTEYSKDREEYLVVAFTTK
ncbi:PQQ-binding-like beta-propeller repeat protein [Streptomyces sp. NBC_01498]|uniref:outer membrane protein assembly factor BamB family protein n=1 Tax=Streptomyces sp. NBC_01498 TaxID=2975870 RepID=UPI002E7B8A49|nr:PQQ-binding-like beta-propeller repeat protein [Streptomyces sp. NBC_01498]WTL26443.1 PQQ-binding-like beta-propeller repeat protein [Streptomyces sp. NBC_01498]